MAKSGGFGILPLLAICWGVGLFDGGDDDPSPSFHVEPAEADSVEILAAHEHRIARLEVLEMEQHILPDSSLTPAESIVDDIWGPEEVWE